MNRWKVTVIGPDGERDESEISDISDLSRTIGAAVVSGARDVVVQTPESTLDVDPTETSREAALGQWEARWAALREMGQWFVDHNMGGPQHRVTVRSVMTEMDQIEQRIPTGKPVGVVRLAPERVTRLIEILRSAGAHPFGLGSYEAANDANALADELEAQR